MTTSYDTSEAITIPLTKGKFTTIDAIDVDLAQLKWTAQLSNTNQYAYRDTSTKSKRGKDYLHRVILARMLDRELIRSEQVDHIDGDGLNNRRSNLRLATKTENCRNQRRSKRNTSGYKGVMWDKVNNKWRSRIEVNGKQIYLGLFKTPEEAHKAYCEAAVKYFGEFARFE